MRFFQRLFITALMALFFVACGETTRKLDEALIHEGSQLQLKLVRYYENLPLHYTGEVFRVQCASVNTKGSPPDRTQEAGWVSLGNGSAIGSKSAAELAARERENYLIIGEQTLVWLGNGVNVTFDACGSFRGWYPTALPADWVVPVAKPSHCQPKGNADCRHYDFLDERTPRFASIEVTPGGHVSFMVRSNALRDNAAVRVSSEDFGRTWQMTRAGDEAR